MEQSGGITNGGVAVRRDILSLDVWDPTVLWYARAIADMQKRLITDPTSWAYQAAIHGHEPETEKSKYWNQCQHGTSFFLPWHRGYLAWFEQIVRVTVEKLKGPGAWALPYWNYSSQTEPDARCLPEAFRQRQTPDGTPNPLFVEQRNPPVNAGNPVGPERDVSVAALDQPIFEGPGGGGNPGFGGPAVGFHHEPGTAGAVEALPHNTIHRDVGGLMGAFSTAPLDPIFWLHHANIDRLWEIWRHEPGRTDPTRAEWLSFAFDIHNAEGNPIQFTPGEVLATTSAPLSYEYDNLIDPRTKPATAAAAAESEPNVPQPSKLSASPPEMVGATEAPLTLTTEPSATDVPISEPTGPAATALASEPHTVHAYLNVENIVSEAPSASYDVYLNLPDGVDPESREDLFVGVLAPFGSERAAKPDDLHAGSGLHFTYDVTRLIDEQRTAGTWNPSTAHVTFVPRETTPDPAPLRVGRVSLYYHS